MILRMPLYCKDFTCTAEKCGDNCCIGWEIDIDDKTAAFYNSITDDFGSLLKKNISNENPKHFILGENERCPFLNEHNLCEIILNLGEDKLCTICTEHPRYYEWFGAVKEGGIGLCCEEAARIILSRSDNLSFWDREIPDEESNGFDESLYRCLSEARSKIIAHLENSSIPFGKRICDIIDYADLLQSMIDNGDFSVPEIGSSDTSAEHGFKAVLEYLLTLEPIDGNWQPYLKKAIGMYSEAAARKADFLSANSQVTAYLQNIAVYFIWRYFLKGTFDGEFLSRVKLAAVSTAVIGYMFCCKWLESGSLTLEDCAQLAKNYSKEIEYSEENLNAVLDAAYELEAFEDNALKGMFL